jgi:starch synthase (maltosyl-transferring)
MRVRDVGMGPRVYDLFPTLAGPISQWSAHFERIAAMGFDWVYINPIHETGGSGSLYAVRDYYRLSSRLRGDDTRPDDEIVTEFVVAAHSYGLRVMLDLVINHTANDSPLVDDHRAWYVLGNDGKPVAPSAIDPADPSNVTVWGDLAEIDFSDRPERLEIVSYFSDVVRHYARLGVDGFRCDAAYKVPGSVWSDLIAAARAVRPDAFFAAETLGCRLEEVAGLAHSGFDALFNSSKWWDFRSGWLLDQYEAFRHIAPSIAFPESHDTPRLAAELGERDEREIEASYRFRYLFAACFSSGVMMPMGYEYGFSKKLDVVTTQPQDWETPRFDLSAFIADVNAMKAAVPALGEEGAQRLVISGDAVLLVRSAVTSRDLCVAAFNPNPDADAELDASLIKDALEGAPRDVTPHAASKLDLASDARVLLRPLEFRVFERKKKKKHHEGPEVPHATSQVHAGPVVIENVKPQIDGGRHAIKRITGDVVTVEADVFRDGHDAIAAVVLYREREAERWREAPLEPLENDRWRGTFVVDRVAAYEYTIEAWPDAFATWVHDVRKKRAAGQSLAVEALEGRAFLGAAHERACGENRSRLGRLLQNLDETADETQRVELLLGDDATRLAGRAPDRSRAVRFEPALPVTVERRAAQFAAWYEFFPRSQSPTPGTHGTFADAAQRLPALREMGFDVVYLPPIHPIGQAFRKGRNNAATSKPEDPGSPWAIGNAHGGHTAVEPALGTLADFDAFVAAARVNGMEVALDYALQCSPDHPFVKEHTEWFAFRPDGTIKYAENPPKKYQDIVNFNWDAPEAPALWKALRGIVLFWIEHGVRTFRVDNPHTKPFAYWEWMIRTIRAQHPDVIFLAEAFTRPKPMNELAKIGFSQSYTYFTWRTTKAELTDYVLELARTEMAEYFRPNFWPNTPDILSPYLQQGGRAAFRIRLVLAATLASVYGIYSGYELCENVGLAGREEYADSEKYELRQRDWNAPGNLSSEIALLNAIRRENAAFADWRNVEFYRADDDAVIFYGKRAGDTLVLVAVNLDPGAARDALLWMPTGEMGIADDRPYDVEELLGSTKHVWRGSPQRWRLDPQTNPAAIFRLRGLS